METADLLVRQRDEIVDAAAKAMRRTHLRHYERLAPPEIRQRLEAMFDRLVESIERMDLGPIVSHAEALARERFHAGFDLSEVQAAMNALRKRFGPGSPPECPRTAWGRRSAWSGRYSARARTRSPVPT
jgi:hypothetical protein